VPAFLASFQHTPITELGKVTNEQNMVVTDSGDAVLDISIATLEKTWRGEIAPNQQPATSNQQLRNNQQPIINNQLPMGKGSPKVLILHANGTNRDRDAALACEMAGGVPEIVHMNQLLSGERNMLDYGMLVVPGGFSYGDDLGAGVIWSTQLGDDLMRFVASGRPTLGICNGFQALVKAGAFGLETATGQRSVTLTYNEQGQFECRWVYLEPNPNSPSLFTRGLVEPIYCPIAHGEGRFMGEVADELVALRYMGEGYPFNPNGSVGGIAGISNPAGNVLGLMPHPEDHIFGWQHPRRHRGESGMLGLRLFENGVKNA
jgi:phosphoribosylformylglycinamidine synthase